MTSTHQYSLADAGSETYPPTLERRSYVPWASWFMMYIKRKKDARKFLKSSIKVGPYRFKEIPATDTAAKTTKNEERNKYVTNVCLTKNLKEDPYDVLFDHLQQYEGLVNASKAKRTAKTHDPLALVANTYARSSSS
ncbi:hypothetical protein Tco_0603988 [Tanacetum coccineum]